MGDKTKISWADSTWTTVSGCQRVSRGCESCYAESLSATRLKTSRRYAGVAEMTPGGEPRWTGLVRTHADILDQPLRWKRPRMIFCNSMSDTFHKDVPNEFIAAIFGIAAACPQHTFQILTKRAERLPEWFAWAARMTSGRFAGAALADLAAAWLRGEVSSFDYTDGQHPANIMWLAASRAAGTGWPLPNVWLGVSCEDQATADERIPYLLRVPAPVHWISYEPALGPLDARAYLDGGGTECSPRYCSHPFLRFVVAGGESGRNARPMHPQWARDLRDQCKTAGVAFHFKQHGEWVGGRMHGVHPRTEKGYLCGSIDMLGNFFETASPWNGHDDDGIGSHEAVMVRVGRKLGGRLLDGVLHDEFPEDR